MPAGGAPALATGGPTLTATGAATAALPDRRLPRGWALPIHPGSRKRVVGIFLFGIATVSLIAAVGGPMWFVQELYAGSGTPSDAHYAQATYNLGGSISCVDHKLTSSQVKSSPCAGMPTRMTGAVGALYARLSVVELGLLSATLAITVLATLGGLVVSYGRGQLALVTGLSIAVGVGTLGLLVFVSDAGVGSQANTICTTLSGGVQGWTAFWGHGEGSQGELNRWGGGAGFYEMGLAAVMNLCGAVFWWARRHDPFTLAELTAWAKQNAPYPLRGT